MEVHHSDDDLLERYLASVLTRFSSGDLSLAAAVEHLTQAIVLLGEDGDAATYMETALNEAADTKPSKRQ